MQKMVEIDASTLKPRDAYAYLTTLIVPRPIAWVSTQDKNGHINLAPFSYFNGLGSDPPMLTLGIGDRPDGSDKDTLRIAKETGFFCVNAVEVNDLERMNSTSAELPPHVSEAERFGIATAPCVKIPGVRIAGARWCFECKLVDVHQYGKKRKANLVVGEVLHLAHDEDFLHDLGAIEQRRLDPLGRRADGYYTMRGEWLYAARPTTKE